MVTGYERHEREGQLLFVQVDHLSSEILGDALTRLWSAGATNVQVVPTLAKKGRPGQLLIIDVGANKLAAIEETLLSELGVHGWHAVKTNHVYVATEIVERDVEVKTPSYILRTCVAGKRRRNSREVIPEHSSCVTLKETLATEAGIHIPLRELVPLVRNALNQDHASIDLRERTDAE